MDEVIEEAAIKDTQTPKGKKVTVFNQVQWYATLLLQTTDNIFWMLGGMVTFYNTNSQHKNL